MALGGWIFGGAFWVMSNLLYTNELAPTLNFWNVNDYDYERQSGIGLFLILLDV